MPLGIFFWEMKTAATIHLDYLSTSVEQTPCKAITGWEKVSAENLQMLNQVTCASGLAPTGTSKRVEQLQNTYFTGNNTFISKVFQNLILAWIPKGLKRKQCVNSSAWLLLCFSSLPSHFGTYEKWSGAPGMWPEWKSVAAQEHEPILTVSTVKREQGAAVFPQKSSMPPRAHWIGNLLLQQLLPMLPPAPSQSTTDTAEIKQTNKKSN